MIAVGVGFSSRCTTEELTALVREALRHAKVASKSEAVCLCTHARKTPTPLLQRTADTLGLPLRLFEQDDLARVQSATETHSRRVEAAIGLRSLAEAAALLGAGGQARLLLPRLTSAHGTCAVAQGNESNDGAKLKGVQAQ